MTGELSSLRLDKWLWAARFFKTRGLASEAVSGGHVHLNGERVKPARALRVGDELRIRKGPQEWTVVVRDLSDRRGPASRAAALYEETVASQAAREQAAEQRKLARMAAPHPTHRPDKKSRRQIIRFKTGGD
ncbi:MAG: S4 domain-containing protein [Gammaproteobacteria bacterium]|jgi:ribosome-associated heat shock protein Hsp15